jgi:hypothetical protein
MDRRPGATHGTRTTTRGSGNLSARAVTTTPEPCSGRRNQAQSGGLWHRFVLELRREIARTVGLFRGEFGEIARLSYAKVAEYQWRGLVHFHAVIRLDGPEGPNSAPPGWATTALLSAAVRSATEKVRLLAPGQDIVGPRVLRFGE